MLFDQIKEKFEAQIEKEFKLEVLEIHYYATDFGSGTLMYRIKGRKVKINYDGKENNVELLISSKHSGTDDWTIIENAEPNFFVENIKSTLLIYLTS